MTGEWYRVRERAAARRRLLAAAVEYTAAADIAAGVAAGEFLEDSLNRAWELIAAAERYARAVAATQNGTATTGAERREGQG